MALAPVSTSANAQGGSSSSLSQLGEDYTRFLTLLTAQVQHQDPLAPMDATQFVSQLAQLSQVEQAVKSNSNLESLGAQMGSLLSVSGAAMLGREVTVSSSEIQLNSGSVDGYYSVAEGTATVSAQIRDPDDKLVRTLNGLSADSSELQKLNWDGLDDLGKSVLDGKYSVTLISKDGDGGATSSFTYRKATVQEVLFTEGQNYFKLDGDQTVASDAVHAAS